MQTLRTRETEERYIEVQKNRKPDEKCFFCDESQQILIKDFGNFRIIVNNFPYDGVADVHHMIYPKRHIKANELSMNEIKELQNIKDTYCKETGYQYMLEGITKLSIPGHAHYHLLTLKAK